MFGASALWSLRGHGARSRLLVQGTLAVEQWSKQVGGSHGAQTLYERNVS